MTKIAIISQPEQGVLIDVGGCSTLQEATQHLTYTLQVSSQFWEDQPVDLSLGKLNLSREELGQVFATLQEVGVRPRHIFAEAANTKAALRAYNITPATGTPASLPVGAGEQSPVAYEAPAATAEPVDQIVQTSAKQPAASRDTVPVEVDGTICGALPDAPPVAAAECAPAATTQHETCEAETDTGACTAEAAEGAEVKAEATEGEDKAATTAEAGEESGEEAEAQPKVQEPAKPPAPAAPHILYLRQTLRSGQAVSHKGHLVIIGDVNPGAEVIAEGDITIWGALRGVAHAGVGGNTSAEIRALRFDPIQLRIAHAIARSPDRPRGGQRYNGPETARIVNGTIRISSSAPE